MSYVRYLTLRVYQIEADRSCGDGDPTSPVYPHAPDRLTWNVDGFITVTSHERHGVTNHSNAIIFLTFWPLKYADVILISDVQIVGWMIQNLAVDKSTLVQVMTPSHYLNQCLSSSGDKRKHQSSTLPAFWERNPPVTGGIP